MTDIWSFLLQTLTASGVAALLLIVKAMFRDKLSPRWQFAIWGVLAAVLLLLQDYLLPYHPYLCLHLQSHKHNTAPEFYTSRIKAK